MIWWVATFNDEDPDRTPPKEASMVKLFVTETARRVALEGHADHGRLRLLLRVRHGAPRPRHAVSTIYGGTSGIQRAIIAKTLGL